VHEVDCISASRGVEQKPKKILGVKMRNFGSKTCREKIMPLEVA